MTWQPGSDGTSEHDPQDPLGTGSPGTPPPPPPPQQPPGSPTTPPSGGPASPPPPEPAPPPPGGQPPPYEPPSPYQYQSPPPEYVPPGGAYPPRGYLATEGAYPPGGPIYPGYAGTSRGTNGLAVAAFICSLAGLFVLVSAPVGAVLGHIAKRQIAQTGEEGAGFAQAAIIIGWIITGLFLAACCIGAIVLILVAQGTNT